jgi:hypothetical protein
MSAARRRYPMWRRQLVKNGEDATAATHPRRQRQIGPQAVFAAVRFSVSNLLHQQPENCLEMIVGEFLQFFISAILHRMRHEHVSRVGAQSLRLHCGGIDELGGGNSDRRNSAGFEICKVMRTARRAGASISQTFDDQVHLAHDLLP